MFRWYERRESHPDIPMTSSLCQRLSRSAPAIIQISLITITVVQLHHEQHRRQSWFLRSDSVDQCFIIIIIIIVVIITCVSQCLVPSATERRGEERRGGERRCGSTSLLLCTSVSHCSTRPTSYESWTMQMSRCRDKRGVTGRIYRTVFILSTYSFLQ